MFGFGKEKKDMSGLRLTREELDVLSAVYTLVRNGRIPFNELNAITENHSTVIEAYVKEQHKEQYQRVIEGLKYNIQSIKKDIESLKQKLDKYSSNTVEMRAELEDQKKKRISSQDENRIKNLLYWIFNIENDSERLRDEIASKEAQLKVAEDELANKEKKKK